MPAVDAAIGIGSGYPKRRLPQNVVLWLKGENNCNDSSGRGLNGAWVGDLPYEYVAGVIGNAFKFSGKKAVEVANDPLIIFDPTGEFAVSFYVRITADYVVPYHWIVAKSTIVGTAVNWAFETHSGYFYVHYGTGFFNKIIPGFALNKWCKFLVSYNNKKWKAWYAYSPYTTMIDLGLSTNDYPIGTADAPLRVGNSYSYATKNAYHDIDEVKVYNKEMTPADI